MRFETTQATAAKGQGMVWRRDRSSNASCSMLLPGPFIACALLRPHSRTTRATVVRRQQVEACISHHVHMPLSTKCLSWQRKLMMMTEERI